MKFIFKLFFYLTTLYLIFSVTSIAEENGKNQTDQKKDKEISSSTNKENSVKQSISKRGQVKTLEEFIPSEEVSADKPVAFPTDI